MVIPARDAHITPLPGNQVAGQGRRGEERGRDQGQHDQALTEVGIIATVTVREHHWTCDGEKVTSEHSEKNILMRLCDVHARASGQSMHCPHSFPMPEIC